MYKRQVQNSDVVILGVKPNVFSELLPQIAPFCTPVSYTHLEVRVAAWYDNEMSYVSQLIRTLGHMVSLL